MNLSKHFEKICRKCKIYKSLEEYYCNKAGRFNSYCKPCWRERVKEKSNTEEKKREKALYDIGYRDLKKEEIKNYKINWYNNNQEKVISSRKRNRKNATKNANLKNKIRRKIDPNFALRCALRISLNKALNGKPKVGSAVKDLGCMVEELVKHLESKFYTHPKTGEMMSWSNRGLYGWHIDHINPLCKFDLTDRKQLLKAYNYTNLQPLWAIDNLKKELSNERKGI